MAEPAANDFVAIRAAILRLKYERFGCNLRKNLPSADCWCWKAGPQGQTLPCPPEGWDSV
jgi:hypothetical protein